MFNGTVTTRLVDWSNWHSFSLLLVSVLIYILDPAYFLLPLSGAISFGWLIVLHQNSWTPNQKFGWANLVTSLRLGIILTLPLTIPENPGLLICLALIVLVLDGLDGWLARKLELVSEFGEFYDKESDAYFMLTLCWLLYMDHRLPGWILFSGLMRYIFVVMLMVLKPKQSKEHQTTSGKFIYLFSISLLVFCFTPYNQIYRPLAMLMTVTLAGSFIFSIYQLKQL